MEEWSVLPGGGGVHASYLASGMENLGKGDGVPCYSLVRVEDRPPALAGRGGSEATFWPYWKDCYHLKVFLSSC